MIVMTDGRCDWCGRPDARLIGGVAFMCTTCYPDTTGGQK